MPRLPRELKPGYSYHITSRCNNREFRLTRRECRELLLYAIKKAQQKFQFKLYGLCIMSNHVHYLLEPAQPEAGSREQGEGPDFLPALFALGEFFALRGEREAGNSLDDIPECLHF